MHEKYTCEYGSSIMAAESLHPRQQFCCIGQQNIKQNQQNIKQKQSWYIHLVKYLFKKLNISPYHSLIMLYNKHSHHQCPVQQTVSRLNSLTAYVHLGEIRTIGAQKTELPIGFPPKYIQLCLCFTRLRRPGERSAGAALYQISLRGGPILDVQTRQWKNYFSKSLLS